ncbi:MAG: HEPN domain-containing protein [Crenarchaeota archaeon]|nr:HEPN domain-containing protein [Thermoproteota archaeon]
MTHNNHQPETINQTLHPKTRAKQYIKEAHGLLQEAVKELEKGDPRQAAEKLWGAAALAVKAYAYWKEGKRLTSHKELWQYKDRLRDELGEWVYDAWMAANGMHTCFYEGWCTRRDVEEALKQVERLVKGIEVLLERC